MKSWLQHLKGVGPTWCYVLASMCHLLCCRVTEVLRLQAKHVDLAFGRVQVGELKKQEKILKPLTDTAKTFFTQLRDNAGHSEQRTRRFGSRGYVTYQDSWSWPTDPEAFLFPATRKDAVAKHMNKDTASAAIRRARASFVPPAGTDVKISSIRSHSSRQRAINDLKVTGVSTPIGKRFARIVSDRVWEGYGQLTTDQVDAGLKQATAFQQLQNQIYYDA
ncbi:unnamed protein product [Symbiodinium sp. CCMP2592]|nr:unnamed protein product [Symbiodinium sp. CCMP2592]